MLASGLKKNEIVTRLDISKNTIGNHRNSILKKMNMETTSELTRYAINYGLIK
jgi:DNA-binding NarL/FixJ family response regulator